MTKTTLLGAAAAAARFRGIAALAALVLAAAIASVPARAQAQARAPAGPLPWLPIRALVDAPAPDAAASPFGPNALAQRAASRCSAERETLHSELRRALQNDGDAAAGLARAEFCIGVLADADEELLALHRRLQIATLRAALRSEPPRNVERRGEMIRELAKIDPNWRLWHGREMTRIEALEQAALKRKREREERDAKRERVKGKPEGWGLAPASLEQRRETLEVYATLLGRAHACGIGLERERRLTAGWIDEAFPVVVRQQQLQRFAESMKQHAQRQARGASGVDCDSVRRTLSSMSDRDWSGPR